MNRNTAMHILNESQKAKEALFYLVPKHIPVIKDYNKRDDIEAKIYKGIFNSYHTIMSDIQDEIFKVFPEVKKDFFKLQDEKYLQVKKQASKE